MTAKSVQVCLAERPQARFRPEHFQLRETDIARPREGQVLVRLRWLSLDPMLRIFINPATMGSSVTPLPVGAPIVGPAVGEVVESQAEGYRVGDWIEARAPWQDLAVLDAAACRWLPQDGLPKQTAIGVLGMPGFTAFLGIELMASIPAGGTILISGAAGTVGSVAGQIARDRGQRAVGIASGPERCAYLESLGFSAAVDRSSADFVDRLRAATPDGVHGYFDNVGGDLFGKVLPSMRRGGVILICGLSAHYQGGRSDGPTSSDDRIATVLEAVMGRQLTILPLSNRQFVDRFDEFIAQVGAPVARGDVRLPEVIHEGLRSAPEGFARLLDGRDLGKHLVRV